MKSVLSIHLGPVQEFIASARRCQDLWFGSWLLSELSKATAAGINAHGGAAVVFPGAEPHELGPGGRRNVANKIVARVDGDLTVAAVVAEAGRTALHRRLDDICDATFASVATALPGARRHFDEPTARAQVAELIEYFWAAAVEGEAGYRTARREAERLLAARKNTQRWTQPSWAKPGVPKSSLDGVRESVLHEDLYSSPFTDADRFSAFRVSSGERLCGVGVLKRNGLREGQSRRGLKSWRQGFFSTSHVAALPWIESVERISGAAGAWADFANALDEIDPAVLDSLDCVRLAPSGLLDRVDGAVLYEGRLRDAVKSTGGDRAAEESAVRAQRRFFATLDRSPPQPYYAILHADGDRMGAVIEAQHDFESHFSLSSALTRFAGAVPGIVEGHGGALIYAGGDDVLAFVPLHRAMDCAEVLAERFARETQPWEDADGRSPSLTAGVAVVHHLTRMGEAIEVAREAERRAKQVDGKNALAVIVDKRAGAQVAITGSRASVLRTLRPLVALKRLDAISDRAAHELLALAALTEEADDADREKLSAVQRSEALRILRRKRAEGGTQDVASATLDRLEAAICDEPDSALVLARLLLVAEVFARAEDEADVDEPQNPDAVMEVGA